MRPRRQPKQQSQPTQPKDIPKQTRCNPVNNRSISNGLPPSGDSPPKSGNLHANFTNSISVIIPARNEAANIPDTLRSVLAADPFEVVVVDGGSRDETARIASDSGVSVLTSPPGRALQMNAGADRTTGEYLLFLHSDSRLPTGWKSSVVQAFAEDHKVVAGAFRFAIEGDFPGRRFVEWSTNLRSRWLQLPYGDQGLFLRRTTFNQLGGFAGMPILEDYDLVRRLQCLGRIVTLDSAVRTSGRRWRTLGVWRTTWINQLMIAGYHLRISPDRLARVYQQRSAGGNR